MADLKEIIQSNQISIIKSSSEHYDDINIFILGICADQITINKSSGEIRYYGYCNTVIRDIEPWIIAELKEEGYSYANLFEDIYELINQE